MRILSIILVLFALVKFGETAIYAESAPQQAAGAAMAAFWGIMARLAQASGHHFDKKGL